MSPRDAALIGTAAVVAIGLGIGVFGDGLNSAAQALLFVVPVTVTAALGGRRAAQVIAAVATLVFTLVLPPVGTLRIRFADDTVALAVFSIVAFTTGTLVAHRIEALASLERERAALLRSVSHDLRTPLSAIQAAVSDLQDETVHDASTRRRLLELVGQESQRLDRFVANLLSLARVEGAGLQPHRQAIDLGELVEGCVERLGLVSSATQVTMDIPPDIPILHADYAMLDQLITNLLENAARHSPADKPVTVVARATRSDVRISVSDRGPGVPDHDVEAIFEPFRSGQLAGSTGVGLAICKAVVESHGGTIGVGGTPGGGAEFTVALPLR
jgi:two-component system sensor histidine kinase KdpD